MTKQELVDFLLIVDKQHINELIDIVTDFGKGRLMLSSNVKDVLLHAKEFEQPFTKKELDLLIQEFQDFSGHTIINLVRDVVSSQKVEYKEILDDVFSRVISESHNDLSDKEKEDKIIAKLFGDKWLDLPFKKRYEASSNKRYLVKSITSTIMSTSSGILGGTVNKIAAPIGIGLGIVNSFSESSYRLMIPFIAQVAWLKKKYKYYESPSSLVCDHLSKKELLINDSNEVVLSELEYSKQSIIYGSLNENDISAFNQLFNNVPSLAAKYQAVKSHTVNINLDPRKLTPARDGNGLRGMIHEKKGIKENVRIYEAKGLKQAINTGVLWNLASTVVAQKHLADINEKLKDIQQGIDDINEFLNNERTAKLESALESACEEFEYIKEGNLVPAKMMKVLVDKLSNIEDVEKHLEKEMKRNLQKITKLKCDSLFGQNTQGELRKLTKELQNWYKSYREYKLCCNVIMMIYSILRFNTRDKNEQERYETKVYNLGKKASKFMNGTVSELIKHLESAYKNSKGITNFGNTDKANQVFFESRIQNLRDFRNEIIKDLEMLPLSIKGELPINVALRIENGKIIEGKFIDISEDFINISN
ncbi:hypothetical protein [Actinobacillus equuli]|uniref:Uncharacterized protein conserved in bacteria n=1 Tax=Actinobacillus equuli TaxID=718 RepID=A0AAX3FIN9_ACTEU|nr:hypothetical protein [Actinobacillus equuli]AIZ79950.1 hypothetical protein ACEE_09325 [Actinobacillus equuli subsp. equuli]WGE44064.1 hypothetical protein NYR65_09215 [Actinobacillus equuli subsp. equuli]VEE90983.1 Uncharacterized protein conserved in bacteria [Actinobacillus equuli]